MKSKDNSLKKVVPSSPKKVRKFSFVTYHTEDIVIKVLNKHRNSIKCWAYNVHDNEKEKADNHIHLLIHTYSSWEYSSIKNWFYRFNNDEIKANTFVEPILSDTGSYDYLTHANDADKVQYSVDTIRSLDFDLDKFEIQDNGFLPLKQMLDGVPKEEIAKRFGKDFIYHYNSYKALYEDIRFDTITKEPILAEEQCELDIFKKKKIKNN